VATSFWLDGGRLDDNMTGRLAVSSEIARERHVIGPSGEVRAVGVDALCDTTGRLYAFQARQCQIVLDLVRCHGLNRTGQNR
jgi:hypothetical protein